jgi:XRE family transcriptional regulator, regulator of sulfur utilization
VSRGKDRRKEAVIFGATIRRLREDRGWTQETLAERAEMNVSYLGFVERGDNVPTLTIILQLAAALKVEAAELLRDLTKR